MRKHLIVLGALATAVSCGGATTSDTGICDTADTATNCSEDSGETDADTDTDSDTDTDTTPETYTGPLIIGIDTTNDRYPGDTSTGAPDSAINWDCFEYEGELTYFYDFYTVGWVGSAKLTITQDTVDPWYEEHWLASWDYDEYGWWDNLYLSLVDVDSIDEVSENVAAYPDDDAYAATTLFNCTEKGTLPTLAWRLDVFTDTEGTELADCAVWGDYNGTLTDLGDISTCQEYED